MSSSSSVDFTLSDPRSLRRTQPGSKSSTSAITPTIIIVLPASSADAGAEQPPNRFVEQVEADHEERREVDQRAKVFCVCVAERPALFRGSAGNAPGNIGDEDLRCGNAEVERERNQQAAAPAASA